MKTPSRNVVLLGRTVWANWPIAILGVLALPVFLYGLYSLITDYWVMILRTKPPFFEDFEYFYSYGCRALHNPTTLYASYNNIGTWVVSLHTRVFHMYSPIAALMFAPLSLLPVPYAYILHSCVSLAACALSVALFLRIYRWGPVSKREPVPLLVVLFGLAIAPTFHDVYSGNVSSVLLLICVLFIGLVSRDRPGLAGVVLTVGFWLKLYPIILLLLIVGRRDWWKILGSFALTVGASLLVSLAWMPFALFVQFYGTILPEYAKQTTLHIYNQSLPAAIMRIALGPESYLSWDNVLIPIGARFLTYSFAAVTGLFVMRMLFKRSLLDVSLGGALLLALIPLITPVGWGYTFMLVIPLMVATLRLAADRSSLFKSVVFMACAAFFVPSYFSSGLSAVGAIPAAVLYNRYSLAALCLMALVIYAWIHNPFDLAQKMDSTKAAGLAMPLMKFMRDLPKHTGNPAG